MSEYPGKGKTTTLPIQMTQEQFEELIERIAFPEAFIDCPPWTGVSDE